VKAGNVMNITDWLPKEIDLTPINEFTKKIPDSGDVSPYEAYQLSVESARLLDYLSEIRARVELFYLRARSEYRQNFELKSIHYNQKSVSDGERKAQADTDIANLRKQRDYAQAYKVLIEEKMDSLERIHYTLRARHKEAEREEVRASHV